MIKHPKNHEGFLKENEMNKEIFTDNLGNPVSEAELEQWEKEFSAGDYSNWKPVGDVRYGKPHAAKEEKATISFVAPCTLKVRLNQQAEAHNCTTSDLLRVFVAEGLARMS